jgi:hypothetical protein
MTTPFLLVLEYARLTLPVRQCLRAIVRFAEASCLPTTFGTLQCAPVIEKLRETLAAAL